MEEECPCMVTRVIAKFHEVILRILSLHLCCVLCRVELLEVSLVILVIPQLECYVALYRNLGISLFVS